MKLKQNNRLLTGLHLGANLAGLGCMLLTGSMANAGNLYWDTNAVTAGSGNTGGNWGGANWSTDPTGASATGAWVNGESAVFSAGTDGTNTWTVTLATAFSTPSIKFAQTGTKTITGGTINIGGGIIDSSALGAGGGDDINMNSTLAGAGGLTIKGNGDATTPGGGGGGAEFALGGTNTFTGGLKVTGGLVSWSTPANLGDAANEITLDGGGLLVKGTTTTPRSIRIGAAGGTFRGYGGSSFTITGSISNAAGVASTSLKRTDGGTVFLAGSGAGFVGTLTPAGGNFQITAPNADWSGANVTSNPGNGVLIVNAAGTTVVKSLSTSTDVILNNGSILNVATGGVTVGTGHWYKTDTGALGKLTSSSGTLTINDGAPSGDLTFTDHQMRVELANSGATPVALVKNNNNSTQLNQANTYSGGTIINGGRLQAYNNASFGTGAVTVAATAQAMLSATLPYANNFNINGNGPTEGAASFGAIRFGNGSVINGTVNVATASRITSSLAADRGTIAGPLTGSAALEKTGAGTISINGSAVGYTGAVTVAEGSFRLNNTLGGSLSVNDSAILSGEGTVSGGLILGSSAGAQIYADGSTTSALSTTNFTGNGVNYVHLTGLPAVPGSTFNVVNYSGTLTLSDTFENSFYLIESSNFRSPPTFANTGSAITLTVAAGENLIWRGDDTFAPTSWDTTGTANWTSTSANPDLFYAGDKVLFDDTGVSKTAALQGLLMPASVTFNNSTGNDYNVTGGAGVGFTGSTGIVKNNSGTVTIGGWSHNYTGAVLVNGGILRAASNEALGNSSGITVNAGGQLDINGQSLGAQGRQYNYTIAGAGPNGLGAITNSNAGGVNENLGILNFTISANASVGGDGGRFDIGLAGGAFGTITGGGFTLHKVGSNFVNMRAPATGITYVVDAGSLQFENFSSASGTNPIAVNAGLLMAYGNLTFPNTLNFAAGTALQNNGGGNQVWAGQVNMTGTALDTVFIRPNGGNITLNNVISGASNLEHNSGGGATILTGSASNTYTGATTLSTTGQIILSKSGGAVAIPGNINLACVGTRGIVSTTADNQFGPTTVMRWTGNGDTRLELKGTTQTLAGIDNTAAAPGFNAIQHSEFGTPVPVDAVSDLILNVQGANSFSFGGALRDQGGKVNLAKAGKGTQSLTGGLIDFSGSTTVTEGRLIINSDDTQTSGVAISSGAFYELNVTNLGDTLENGAAYTLTGAGTFVKSGPGTMSMGWAPGASVAMASGALILVTDGALRLEYGPLTTWTNNKSDLTLSSGGTLDLWDNNNGGVIVDSLNGSGSITRTSNAAATGSITVGVDNGSGDFQGEISNALGKTNLVKLGSGTQTLSGANSYSGNTNVNGGTLALANTGSLRFVIADASNNQVTGTGTVIINGSFVIDTSAVTVTTGSWTLVNTAALAATFGATFSPAGPGWVETSNVWKKTSGSQVFTFTEASGVLALSSESSYVSWINGFFPGETNQAIIGANKDPDGDGIANGTEMVIGGNPSSGMNVALLPTLELVVNPVGVPAGSYFLFTYRRTDLAVAAAVASICEYNLDLVGVWTSAQNGVNGVSILEDDNYASFVPAAANTDRVRVYIPRNSNSKIFGRLKVLVP